MKVLPRSLRIAAFAIGGKNFPKIKYFPVPNGSESSRIAAKYFNGMIFSTFQVLADTCNCGFNYFQKSKIRKRNK